MCGVVRGGGCGSLWRGIRGGKLGVVGYRGEGLLGRSVVWYLGFDGGFFYRGLAD